MFKKRKLPKGISSSSVQTDLSNQSSTGEWMFFQTDKIPHNCERKNDKDDLYSIYPGKSIYAYVCRFFRRLFICSHTKRAITFFRSHACIDFERSRQLRLHRFMIHPFSIFRIFWEISFTIVLLNAVVLNSYIYAFPSDKFILNEKFWIMKIVSLSDSFCIIDVVLQFITGKMRKDVRKVDLQFSIVAKRYLKTYFILDAIAAVPVIYLYKIINTSNPTPRSLYIYGFFIVFLRLARTVPYVINTCEVLYISHERQVYILIGLGMLYYFHLSACFIFYLSVLLDATTESWYQDSGIKDLNEAVDIYHVSLTRAIFTALGLCLRFLPRTVIDQISTLFYMWTGLIFFLILVGKNFQLTRAKRSSSTTYEAMITQVGQYMESRKLPRRLQHRVIEFYHFRFHRAYYSEEKIMGGISRQLKQDYMFHQCQSLVEKVAFFSELPTHVLIRIVTALKVEFCLDHETVIKQNTTGSAMYFIRSGTVAVYAASGAEVCHLEDGNHFGEISLVLAHFRRVASIVTIENCEFYRLERDDFNAVMAPYPEYLKKVRTTAMRRLEKAMRLDQQHEHLSEFIKANTVKDDSTEDFFSEEDDNF